MVYYYLGYFRQQSGNITEALKTVLELDAQHFGASLHLKMAFAKVNN
jgi:hypothetical protein